jgi:2-dehydropantoate 2-reductase
MIGACLAHVGESVTLVVRPETIAAHPPNLQLESPFGNWSAEVDWATLVPAADVLWLTVKATQLDGALAMIGNGSSGNGSSSKGSPGDRLSGDSPFRGAIVPLLNGLDHLQVLRGKFGEDRVIPATIAGEMERVSVGHIVHRSPFAVLNISSRGQSLLEPVCEKLRGLGFNCKFLDDEATLMWSKLVFLGPFALATTAFDQSIGEVIANAEHWRQLEASVRETCAAGQAEGAKVEADAILQRMKTTPAGMRSSMQKDVENGRPPELDAIGGAIVRAARRHGLGAPVTEALMAQIERRVESRTRR